MSPKKNPVTQLVSFEDRFDDIKREVEKRRSKWYLTSISYIDFDDAAQIVFTHVHEKWHLWDQSLQLEPWLNTVISNQIKNIARNNYGIYARPCINCPFNEGYDNNVNLCAFTSSGEQCAQCPLYARWVKNKQSAYNIKIPLAYDFHSNECGDTPVEHCDLDSSVNRLHSEMKKRLNSRFYAAYEMLFVQNVPEEEVARFMGYKTTEKNMKAGYKQIRKLKIRFLDLAKKILQEEDVIF